MIIPNRKLASMFWIIAFMLISSCILQTMRVKPVQAMPQGSTFYVSSSGGDDDNDGLSASEPFATVNKVNNLDLQPGDQVLFKCGDIWQAEQLVLKKSGSENAPILFGAYPSDCTDKPALSGSRAITGWTLSEGTIYEASLSPIDFPSGINQLFRDGVRLPLGRWPNLDEGQGGYSTIDGHLADSKEITDNELPDHIDWTGAVIHLKNIRWSLINREVTASTGSTITLNKKFSCLISNWGDCIGWGYFIHNHYATLDQDGEWYYDSAAQKVYLVSTSGPPQEIEGSVILDDVLTSRHGGLMLSDGLPISYVVVDNLEIKNWFNYGIGTPASLSTDIYHHITLRNLTIKDVDSAGIRLSSWLENPSDGRKGLRGGNHMVFENNRIDGANHFGITGYFAESTFEGNQIVNVGLIENLGKTGMGCGLAAEECAEYGDGIRIRLYDVRDSGFGNRLTGNRFEKIAYNAVDVFGPENILERNLINQACFAKADCGGIRVYGNHILEETDVYNVQLIENIIFDIPGNVDGCHESRAPFGMGLYIDHYARDIEVRGNTVISTTVTGILYQRATGIIRENTVYNSSTGTAYTAQLSLVSDSTQVSLSDNILYGLNEEAWTLYASSLNNFASSDHNYLFHPYIDEHIAYSSSWTRYTFDAWQAFSGLETHSQTNWFSLNPGDPPRSKIFYNDTWDFKSFDLGTRKYLDLDQNAVVGAVTLAPFTSQILIDDGSVQLTLQSLNPFIWDVDEAADFVLTVRGLGFTENSIVRWDGEDRTTSFVNSTVLTTTIPAAEVSAVAQIPVTVFDPVGNPSETPALIFWVVEQIWPVFLPLMFR